MTQKSDFFAGNVSSVVRDGSGALLTWREGAFDYKVYRDPVSNKPLAVTSIGTKGRYRTEFNYTASGTFSGTRGDVLHSVLRFELFQESSGGPDATPTPGVWYVNAAAAVNGNGSQLKPFNLLQSAINAASDFDTIFVTTRGDHAENIVMRDLNGIAIIGNSESNTAIANIGASHTFTWVPGATTGVAVRKFTLRNIEFINDDTTGTYHGIHVDASAVVYPNTFCADEFDMDVVDVEAAGGQGKTSVYFRNTGQVFWTHGQALNGDVTLINPSVFRTRQVEIGGLGAPANLNVTYDGALEHNGIGRSDVSIGQQSIVWGNVVPNGHPIFQMDQSSLIVGNLGGGILTSYYSSGRDYCPVFSVYGQLGILGVAGGNINLTFPDPQASGSAFNIVDMSRAHVLGTVSFTKTNFVPANARGVAVVLGQAQFDTTTVGGLSANGFVALDLRGAEFNVAALASTGAASVDRDKIAFSAQAITTAGTTVAINPPLPTGATYAVAATPSAATTVFVSNKAVNGFKLTPGANCNADIAVIRV